MMQENSLNIQWYPGHMTKTRRQMDLKMYAELKETAETVFL